jgi:anti-sigma factor RsiW
VSIDKPDEHDELRMLLGGYLLGGLDDADTDRLDAHLLDCDRCREELDRLSPIPELLQRLPDATLGAGQGGPNAIALAARPSAARIEGLLSKMRAERSRDRRLARVRWLAAAAVVLIAAVIGIGVVTGNRDQTPPQALPSPHLVTAPFEPAAGSGLSGEAILTPKTWGVAVSLDVTRLQGDGPFYCQVRDANGDVEQAAVWGPTPTGSAKVTGASSIQIRDVTAIAIADKQGHVLGTASLR